MLSPLSRAQGVPTNPITDPNLTTGLQPYSNLPSDTENVNLANGNVSVSIPLLSLPGINGMDLNLAVNFDSKNVALHSHYQSGYWGYMLDGWTSYDYNPDFAEGTLSIPRLSFSYDVIAFVPDSGDQACAGLGNVPVMGHERFYFTDSRGAKHTFSNQRDIQIPSRCAQLNGSVTTRDISDSIDGSTLRLDTTGWPVAKVYQKDGTVITFNIPSQYITMGSAPVWAPALYPSAINDRNGNTITFSMTSDGGTITDTLGRTITITPNTISYYDSNHNQITWTVSTQAGTVPTPALTATYCKALGPAADPNGGSGFMNPVQVAPPSTSFQGIVTITQTALSGNTRTYTVTLDSLGEPVNITYPTGGYTSYTYQAFDAGPYSGDSSGDTQCEDYTISRVTSKSSCSAASGACTTPAVTTYSATPWIVGNVAPTVIVYDPADSAGNRPYTVHNFKLIYGYMPEETLSARYTAGGSLIRSIVTQYAKPIGGGTSSLSWTPAISKTITMNDASPALTYQTQTDYNTIPAISTQIYANGPQEVYIDNPSEERIYGFDGSLVKKTDYTWNSAGIYSVSANHILDHIASKVITDVAGGKAESFIYSYDGIGDVASVSVTGTSLSAPLVTTYGVNTYGQITSVTDPRGFVTGYSYANAWADTKCQGTSNTAHAPSVITDALGHKTQRTYYSCSGELARSTDANSQTTGFTYDGMGRVSQINNPDKGGTSYAYVDTPPLSVTSTTLLSLSNTPPPYVSTTLYDGLGRPYQTQASDPNSPSGQVYSTTTYDSLGRIASLSNPYWASSDASYGWTTYLYDALNRKTSETAPDGSVQYWCYDGQTSSGPANCPAHIGTVQGTWVNYQDASGNMWQRTYDALGRLTEVEEPNGISSIPSMETDYSYDGMNNLTSATQWGGSYGSSGVRNRSFIYDGISRLMSTTNPESGTITYNYLINGIVCAGDVTLPCSKTDARGVTTSYAYDALKRIVSKTFSNDPSCTPWSYYQYDSPSVLNGIGRLSTMWTQSASSSSCQGSTPSSGYWTMRSIQAYDAMGRLTSEQQFTPGSQATGTVYAPAYTYDLAGNLITSTDGITPAPTQVSVSAPCLSSPLSSTTLTIINCMDSGRHLQSVMSNLVDNTHPMWLLSAPPSASTPSYAPFGGLMNATFGSGLTLNRAYDNRLRITSETDTGSNNWPAVAGSAKVTIIGTEQSK